VTTAPSTAAPVTAATAPSANATSTLKNEVADSGHWPMYSNLPALRACIAGMAAE
jgi:hypothetical protein